MRLMNWLTGTKSRSRQPRKIDYAVLATAQFVRHLHREGMDRGMIATFGDTARVEQHFTSSEQNVMQALAELPGHIKDEGTLLYDAIEAVIGEFWRTGARDRPWFLTIITDGADNRSKRWEKDPSGIGRFIATRFNHERSNFITLVGVGEGRQLDRQALATISSHGEFPAVTVQAFELLEQIFLKIALQATEQVIGHRIDVGNLSWTQMAHIRRQVHVPVDYVFLLDRSGSMKDPA